MFDKLDMWMESKSAGKQALIITAILALFASVFVVATYALITVLTHFFGSAGVIIFIVLVVLVLIWGNIKRDIEQGQ